MIPAEWGKIFREEYRRLRPRAPLPEFQVQFYRFAGIRHTIRLREGVVYARLSDLMESAPASVVRSLAHLLLAKLYRRRIGPAESLAYRRYALSRPLQRKAELVRQARGRKHAGPPRGRAHDLESLFDSLNRRYFHGLLGRPVLGWSRKNSRWSLGHYDPAHNTIIVSSLLDHPKVPQVAVEYILYHEMLHLKHPVRVRAGRRCVHSREFLAEERLFEGLEDARAFVKRLGSL